MKQKGFSGAMSVLAVHLIVLGLVLPVVAVDVDCSSSSLQDAIDAAEDGATINVTGTCSEDIVIREGKDRITLDGGGSATIQGDGTTSAVMVRGRGAVIKGFTITGGRDGVTVEKGGTAKIESNTISGNSRYGINIILHSFAVIMNNTIQNNGDIGILVNENSSARIGFESVLIQTASPNTIQGNGGNGIVVVRSSNARIVGNTIAGNTGDGVAISRGSHADVCNNTIYNNRNGILVALNSGANLGSDTGTSIFDLPNSTIKPINSKWGVRATVGSYVDGRMGTLRGKLGSISVDATSINSTIP